MFLSAYCYNDNLTFPNSNIAKIISRVSRQGNHICELSLLRHALHANVTGILSVCLSVTLVICVKTVERIELRCVIEGLWSPSGLCHFRLFCNTTCVVNPVRTSEGDYTKCPKSCTALDCRSNKATTGKCLAQNKSNNNNNNNNNNDMYRAQIRTSRKCAISRVNVKQKCSQCLPEGI